MFVVVKNIAFHERGRVRRTVTPTNKIDFWLGPMRIPARTTAVKLDFYRRWKNRFDEAVDLGLIELDFKPQPGEDTDEVAKIMAELFPKADVVVDGKASEEEVGEPEGDTEETKPEPEEAAEEPEVEPEPEEEVGEPEGASIAPFKPALELEAVPGPEPKSESEPEPKKPKPAPKKKSRAKSRKKGKK